MTKSFKVLLAGALAFTAHTALRNNRDARSASRNQMRAQDQVAQIQVQYPRGVTRIRRSGQGFAPVPERSFAPIRNLYSLQQRGCENDDLSALILQNELIKKDRRLAYQQHDIDDCNDMVLSYVERGVRENSSYYLRRKLVESFGQTNRTVLINRLRLVAVLLGGERGTGGMDPAFTPIREEAHRISPYVVVLVQDYIDKLEQRMTRAGIDQQVDLKFKKFVDSLGDSYQSEYGIADTGARNRNEPAKELYALKVLLRDLREYYGERVVNATGEAPFEVIFTNPGSFQSETLTDLQRRHRSMRPTELTKGFVKLGLELRQHLSGLRGKRRPSNWGDDEELNHLKKLNEIVASVTGLFAAERRDMDPVEQALTLVDLLFLEGLYTKKQRKQLQQELSVCPALGSGNAQQTRAFHSFLNYMHGLAYAKMDSALGDAARAYSKITKEAENYMEVLARKSSLQVLGQLQLEFYQAHQKTLARRNDVHLAGKARGRLRVFRTEQEIAAFLQDDPLNGAETLWVLKRGLNMPNNASFAAIILEDPILKASHYDGYARSKRPPIPLLQVPGAADSYAEFDGKYVALEASKDPFERVAITETTRTEPPRHLPVAERIRLPHPDGVARLFEIDAAKGHEEIRVLQEHAGSKAANYAFLRSVLASNNAKSDEHIYPGFAVPFYFYQRHLVNSGTEDIIASLAGANNSQNLTDALIAIRSQIMNAPVDDALVDLICRQMDDRLKTQHRDRADTVKLRFRSSSNAEDNKDFSGAGLYESHFALYAYENGRAANRAQLAAAIKRVWASLWNAEAYQARERAGIEQPSVCMGILVHPSYRNEESTGVVYYYAPDDIEIVVNKGNDNVQNPSIAGLTPEMHRIKDGAHQLDHSSRFILSENVVFSSKDRKQLMRLLKRVVPRFRDLYPEQDISGVDVEFKVLEIPAEKGDRDVVMLKQIRPLAKRADAN